MFKKLTILGLTVTALCILGIGVIKASTNSNTNSSGTTPFTPSTEIKNWHELE